ncbi:MAG TPA: ABC transporter permease [Negativicutes bacterium]|nr:ABC transporter permease [Negativicutes bacterium]
MILKGLLLPIILLLWWLVAAALQLMSSYLLPSPASIVQTALQLIQKGVLAEHVAISMYRVLAGFCLTFLIAFPFAVLLGMNRRLIPYVDPLLNFIRHIPPIACIPLLILWLGIGEASKLAIIMLAAFFPLFLNTLAGIEQCDGKLVEVGQVFGFTKKERFLKIILPASLPSIILGMRLGLGYSWRALIGAELIAASAGIGYMIIEAEQLSRPDVVIVGIIVIGLFGYLIDYVFLRISRLIVPWTGEKVNNDSFSAKGAL